MDKKEFMILNTKNCSMLCICLKKNLFCPRVEICWCWFNWLYWIITTRIDLYIIPTLSFCHWVYQLSQTQYNCTLPRAALICCRVPCNQSVLESGIWVNLSCSTRGPETCDVILTCFTPRAILKYFSRNFCMSKILPP